MENQSLFKREMSYYFSWRLIVCLVVMLLLEFAFEWIRNNLWYYISYFSFPWGNLLNVLYDFSEPVVWLSVVLAWHGVHRGSNSENSFFAKLVPLTIFLFTTIILARSISYFLHFWFSRLSYLLYGMYLPESSRFSYAVRLLLFSLPGNIYLSLLVALGSPICFYFFRLRFPGNKTCFAPIMLAGMVICLLLSLGFWLAMHGIILLSVRYSIPLVFDFMLPYEIEVLHGVLTFPMIIAMAVYVYPRFGKLFTDGNVTPEQDGAHLEGGHHQDE